jgi:hypothetical protein
MKPLNFSRFFHPLYLLTAGLFGVGILFAMSSPVFPLDCGDGAATFFCVPGFSVVFTLMGILWCMLTIFFIPGYAMFIWLFREHVAGKDRSHRFQEVAQLLLAFSIIAISSYLSSQALYQFSPDAQGHWNAKVPNSAQFVIDINTVCLFLVILPYMLSMFLLHSVIRGLSSKIQNASQVKTDLSFRVINDLLAYRKMLQTMLIISGALLSMVPLIMVALRSILISIDPNFAEIYPVTYVIFTGLIFTLLLLFIYVPAYLELSMVGGQLRDVLYPLHSLNDLKDTLDKRKILDDLLQTQVSLTANLKSGILTFGPLVSSLLVLLGIKT